MLKKQARLRCAHGATAGEAIAPVVIALDSENGMWLAPQLLVTAAPVTVDDLPARFAGIPTALGQAR